MAQIMGFVEDEKTLSTLVFMKKIWNWLCEHLNLVIHMYAQPFYTITIFFYKDAITTWIKKKTQKGFSTWNFGSLA